MALIKCTDCATEVSDKATACPKCGRPIRNVLRHVGNIVGLMCMVLIVVLFLVFLNSLKYCAEVDGLLQSNHGAVGE